MERGGITLEGNMVTWYGQYAWATNCSHVRHTQCGRGIYSSCHYLEETRRINIGDDGSTRFRYSQWCARGITLTDNHSTHGSRRAEKTGDAD